MSRIRVVVADQAEAIFYDIASLKARPVEVGRLSNPGVGQHGRDRVGDRPAQVHDNLDEQRHAIGRVENDPRQQETAKFARAVADKLNADRSNREFQQLIVVAGAPFRGLMRAKLSAATKACVVHEVPKDLVHSPVDVLRDYLPDSAQELKSA